MAQSTIDRALFKDTILSIEKIGGKYHNLDGIDIYFLVKKNSQMGKDLEIRRNIRDFLMGQFGYNLMVGFVE